MTIFNRKDAEQDDPMLGLFLSMLDVRMKSIESQLGQDCCSQAIFQELKDGITKMQGDSEGIPGFPSSAAWNEAYRLERLLALIEPPGILALELKRRINETIEAKLPSVERLKADVNAAITDAFDRSKQQLVLNPGGCEILKNPLINLLEEIHWTEQRNFYAGPIQKAATQRIVTIGLTAFIFVMLPYLVMYCLIFLGINFSLKSWVWFPFYTVVTTGAFGAFFSRLTYILRNLDRLPLREIQSAKSAGALFLRGSVGTCGALVVFFFLKSGLIEGQVFPNFEQLGLDFLNYPIDNQQAATGWEVMQVIVPSKSLALLIMWSFLAGFSERLVPSILSNTEKSFSNATSRAFGETN